jgi:rare lipoprotein A
MRKLGVGAVCLALALAGALGPSTAPAAEARDAPRARAEAQRPDRGGARAAVGSGRAGSVAQRPPARVQRGKASYYGREFHGRRMANGRRFDAGSRSAAHRTLPLGTRARVTNLENGRTETVVVEDRGPRRRDRILDVSPRTAGELGMRERGVAPVEVAPVEVPGSGGDGSGSEAASGGGPGKPPRGGR